MKNWILKLLGFHKTEEEKRLSETIDKKQNKLDKYGGKIIISERGGMRHEFPSKELESAYWQEVMKEIRKDWDKHL